MPNKIFLFYGYLCDVLGLVVRKKSRSSVDWGEYGREAQKTKNAFQRIALFVFKKIIEI